MTSVQKIKTAIQRLSREDLYAFREWFEEFYVKAWDGQFDDDTEVGEGLAKSSKRKSAAPKSTKEPKRELGLLEGKAKVVFADDFKMTDEELINL